MTKMILAGVGIVGCVGVLSSLKRPLPPPGSPPPQFSGDLAARSPEPVAIPLVESRPESSASDDRPRKRVSTVDDNLRKAFRERVRAVMESSDPADPDRVFSSLAKWLSYDPVGVGRFAKSLPAGTWRDLLIRRVAQDWAAQDWASAERWAARLPDQGERELAEANVCFQVVQNDPRQAVEIAERHGLGFESGSVLENLAQQWAGQNLSDASAWIMDRPEGRQRDQLLGRLAYVESQTEPVAAANLVVEQISAGPIQEEAAMSVLHQWAVRDMASATAWVSRFPPGALRSRAEAELQGLSVYH